jgi:hypothetical protein
LPEQNQFVIVYGRVKKLPLSIFAGIFYDEKYLTLGQEVTGVTHWMVFPEKPTLSTVKVKQYYCTDPHDCRCERMNGFVDSNCSESKEYPN